DQRAAVVDRAAGSGSLVLGEGRVADGQCPDVLNCAAGGGVALGNVGVAHSQRAGIENGAAVVARYVPVLDVEVRDRGLYAAVDLEHPATVAGVEGDRSAGTAAVDGDGAGAGPAQLQLALREGNGLTAQVGVEGDGVRRPGRGVGVGQRDGLTQRKLVAHGGVGAIVNYQHRQHCSILKGLDQQAGEPPATAQVEDGTLRKNVLRDTA